MKINRVRVGYLQCNCYILEINSKIIIIDPGAEINKLEPFFKDKDIVGIMLTHRHFDHIGAVNDIYHKYKTNIYDYTNLEEKEYKLDEFSFEVIKTPGHTLDSITFYFRKDKIMFTGDFLFKGTIGRCDLEESDRDLMNKSITKIKKYDDDIMIYPGHGDFSNLGREKKENPYL